MDNMQKKRLNVNHIIGCPPNEQYRVKKKKKCGQRHDHEMIANISLEWNDKEKGVVSKRDQISLSRRQLIPFSEPGCYSHTGLADVFPVPKGIFDLKSLSDVLSYEVWQSLLSDEERRFLSGFLPNCLSPDAAVQALLAEENFHFGNPFTEWSSSLCHGELHPDSVLERERDRKHLKKCYYMHLHDYHHDMIQNLQFLKGKWDNCRYPEVEFMEDTLRSTDSAEKRGLASEGRVLEVDGDLAATPESCSWDNLKYGDTSDNGISPGESQRRKHTNGNIGDSVNGQKLCSVAKKGVKLLEHGSELGDGTKYMSYVKVSKEQHARFRNSLKHAGDGIHTSSLRSVLGIFEHLDVQPFERFEEEEYNKLRECWLKIVGKDIQDGFLHMRKKQIEKQETAGSLAKEIEQKLLLKVSMDDGKRFSKDKLVAVLPEGEGHQSLPFETNKGEQTVRSDSEHEVHDSQNANVQHLLNHAPLHNPQKISFGDGCTLMTVATSASMHPQHVPQTISHNGYSQADSMECLVDNRSEAGENDYMMVSKRPRSLIHMDSPAVQEFSFPSTSSGWVDDAPNYFNPRAVNSEYAPHQELSLGNQHYLGGQTMGILGAEVDQQAKDLKKDLVQMRTDNHMPFFSPYAHPDCNELLQSVFKDQNNLQSQQQKQLGSDFQPSNYPMIDRGRLPRDIRGEVVHPSLPLEMGPKRLDDIYVRESVFSGGCFTPPSRDHQQPMNQGWAGISPMCMTVTSETHSNGGLPQGLHTYESGFRHGWPSFGASVDGSHSLSVGIGADQTLYSVVSECGEISPQVNHEPVGSTNSFLSPGHFGAIGRGPTTNGLCSSQPLIFSSDQDATASVKLNNLGWMAIPQQNARIPEQFLRSWNR